MKYCGFDLGKKSSVYCIVDGRRKRVKEGKVGMSEHALSKAFRLLPRMTIVLEASTKSFWVADVLSGLGHEVHVLDPRRTKAIACSKIKHDRLDARILADLASAGLLAPVHRPTQAQRLRRMKSSSREGLVRSRTRLINLVRSHLDSEGIVLRSKTLKGIRKELAESVEPLDARIESAIMPVLESIDRLSEAIDHLELDIKKEAMEDETTQRLMTVPGVGPIVATTFIHSVRDPHRFRSGRAVSAYLGLVPSLYQSGKTSRQGRITRQGSRQGRWALCMAATQMLLLCRADSSIKRWAARIAERHGKRKAIVALARKLACVLWAMWKKGTSFEPGLATNS